MILDTNAVSALFEGDPLLEKRLAVSVKHQLPVVVIGEYRYGLLQSDQRSLLEPLLIRLQTESEILYPDLDTAEHYAQIRSALRRAGTPIPENDVWIAALARQHDLAVVSQDNHFDRVAQIRRVRW